MKIQVELFATLAPYLARLSDSSPGTLELPPGSTVDDVAERLGLPEELSRITLVNGHDAGGDHRLRDGDVVSMFPPLAGGAPKSPTGD